MVDIVSAGRAAAVFQNFTQVRQLYLLPHKIARRPWFTLSLLRQLRRQQYDLVIDPVPGSQGARMLQVLIRARRALHADDCATPGVELTRHMALRPVAMVRLATGRTFSPDECPPLDLRLNNVERVAGRQLLFAALGGEPVAGVRAIGLYADASGSKRLPDAWWRALIRRLRAMDPAQRLVEILPADGRPRLAGELRRVFSTSIRPLGAMLAALDVLVTGDCGVMHLARAAGTLTIAVFRTTDLEIYRPYGPGAISFMEADAVPERVASLIEHLLHERPELERRRNIQGIY